jgi:hypothetical protein
MGRALRSECLHRNLYVDKQCVPSQNELPKRETMQDRRNTERRSGERRQTVRTGAPERRKGPVRGMNK